MAVTGKKISEFLPGVLPLVGAEIVPILQSGNKRVTVQDIANYAITGLSIIYLSDDATSVLVAVGDGVFVSEGTVGYDSVILQLATL